MNDIFKTGTKEGEALLNKGATESSVSELNGLLCDDCFRQVLTPFDNGDFKTRCESCAVLQYKKKLAQHVGSITASKHGRGLVYLDDVRCVIEARKPNLFIGT